MIPKSQGQSLIKAHEDAAAFVKAIMRPGSAHELRILHPSGASFSGIYTDPAALARDAVHASWYGLTQVYGATRATVLTSEAEAKRARAADRIEPKAVYICPCPCAPILAARAPGANILARAGQGDAVSASQIVARQVVLIDVDAIKPDKHVSATMSEYQATEQLAAEVVAFLAGRGWPAPISARSGNGAHLVYRVESAPADDNTLGIWSRFYDALRAQPFASAALGDIDVKVKDCSRIWKIPGTWSRKGADYVADDDAQSRRWRVAELVQVPEGWSTSAVTLEQLVEVGALAPEAPAAPVKKGKVASKPAPAADLPPDEPPPPAAGAEAIKPGSKRAKAMEAAAALMIEDTSWVAEAVAVLDPNMTRDQWRGVGIAIKALLGAAGEAVWVEWSRAGASFDGAKIEAEWSKLKDDEPVEGAKALCGMAARHGWTYKAWRAANGVTLTAKASKAEDKAQAKAEAKAKQDADRARLVKSNRRAAAYADPRLSSPLMPHWSTPHMILDETVICVADAITTQMSLCARPVRLGHKLLACDPSSMRWSEVEQGDVAVVLTKWLGKVELLERASADKDEPVYYVGRCDSRKVFAEMSAQARDISRIKQREGVQLVFSDAVLRADLLRARLTIEDLEPSHYATYGYELATSDVRGAAAPRWDAYLGGLFTGGDPATAPLKVEYLKRWIALAVFGATIDFQAPALIIKGKAGTGKSTLGKIVQRLMPPGSTCSVPLQDWEHEYNRAELVGKLLNFVPELAIDEPIGALDQVKKIIFGEETSARQIYSQVQSFYPQAAHLFCANGLPNLRKGDPAVFKRFAQLEVTGAVVRGTGDENTKFAEELLDAEMPGILESLVSAFQRAMTDRANRAPGTVNGLPVLAESQAANEDWRHRSDAVGVFFSECYEFDAGMSANGSPTLADVYTRFKRWCQDNGYAVMNKGSFKTQASNFYTVGTSNKQLVILGASALSGAFIPDFGHPRGAERG